MKLFRISVLAFITVLLISFSAFGQWSLEWTSAGTGVGGWLAFQGSTDNWQYRYYTIDTVAFRVMDSAMSQTPQYSYNFTAPERLAGEVIYSLGVDLTGDGIVEFYVLSDYGTASPYRQSLKVFDITNGQTVFERNVTAYSYSAATVWDADGNGTLDCVFTRVDFPAEVLTSYEVYNTGVSGGVRDHPQIPVRLDLRQNYPNPFNPSTRIDYDLASPGRVRLEILNLLGQKVRTLVNEAQSGGQHSIQWDGTNGAGSKQASGPYYYQIQVNEQPLQTRQMILLK